MRYEDEEGDAAAFVASCGATTLHTPSTHPQLPAPQSSGPSQLAVQAIESQDFCAARFTQLVG